MLRMMRNEPHISVPYMSKAKSMLALFSHRAELGMPANHQALKEKTLLNMIISVGQVHKHGKH